MSYFLALFLLIPTVAMADVYVVTAPDKSVYSVSEANDAVIPTGYSLDVIKGKGIRDLMLDDISLYSYQGKKFNLDDKKVVKKNKDAQDAAIARQAQVDAKVSAIAKLKALGLSDAEVGSIVK